MLHDGNGLEVLDRDECLRLLATASVGRVALSIGAMPVILPVNFAVMGGDVVLRTGPGSKLDAALNGAVVAFEADSIDHAGMSGWSVLVQGFARPLTEPDDLARAGELDLRPWAGGSKDHFVRITGNVVSGRRLQQALRLVREPGCLHDE